MFLPQGVKNLAVVPDPQQLVGHGDPVGVGALGVPEDGVRQPNETDHVAVQGQDLHGAVVSEAAVRPRLGEDDVDLVLLEAEATSCHALCLRRRRIIPVMRLQPHSGHMQVLIVCHTFIASFFIVGNLFTATASLHRARAVASDW